MFQALPADSQEALHKQRLVYCVRSEDEQVMLETCRGINS
jgi:hypothetical protein